MGRLRLGVPMGDGGGSKGPGGQGGALAGTELLLTWPLCPSLFIRKMGR